MCGGASQQQNDLSNEQTQFYTQLQQENTQQFAAQQGVLQQLQSTFSPVLAAGPGQQGFKQPELTAMNTSAEDQVAGNYAKATQAAQGQYAAQGGGNEYVPSGAQAALSGQIGSAASGQLSSEQNQITQANYAQGLANYNNAASLLGGVASQENSTGTASAANSAGSSAANTAAQINQENNSWMSALGGLAGGALSGGAFGAGGAATKALGGLF